MLEIARAGAAAGCHEALFTLGDKPELRYRAARDELAALGCETTLEYLARAARAVLDETGLLPHLNPGVMSRADLDELRRSRSRWGSCSRRPRSGCRTAAALTSARRTSCPARAARDDRGRGRAAVPFTSGILIGIGETREERLETLVALRDLHERHGHLQETIVQNFRAKPGTRMADAPEPSFDELLWTAAAARVILGPHANVQAPPNLTYARFPRLLDAGINDWGGISPVTIDHVNPEAPWPELERAREATESRGLQLAPRLAVYPEYVADSSAGSTRRSCRACSTGSDATGLGREDTLVARRAGAVPFVPRDALPVDSRDELDEDAIVRLFEARGDELHRVLAAADRLRRE